MGQNKSVAKSRAGRIELLELVCCQRSASPPGKRRGTPNYCMTHSYMVFDNVNDMECVVDYRAMFQAYNVIHVLGKSKTGTYSYEVCLDRVPIGITVDMNACILWQVLQQACGPCWAYNFKLLQIMEGALFFRKLFSFPVVGRGGKKM